MLSSSISKKPERIFLDLGYVKKYLSTLDLRQNPDFAVLVEHVFHSCEELVEIITLCLDLIGLLRVHLIVVGI